MSIRSLSFQEIRHSEFLGHSTRATFTAVALYSGILATGSSAAMVNRFTAVSGKWKVIKTTPGFIREARGGGVRGMDFHALIMSD